MVKVLFCLFREVNVSCWQVKVLAMGKREKMEIYF